MDIMEMIKGAINNQVAGQIGTALGTDSQTASKAIGSALPAILSGLVNQASSPTGAANLFGALDRIDAGMLDNLSSALSGGKLQSTIEMGTKLLPTIFGSNYSSILGTLGKLTGLGSGKIGPLLGMLVPIVMGVLAKAKKSTGMDLAGFSQMLADQKKNLAGLDSGFADPLGAGKFPVTRPAAMESVSKGMPQSRIVARSAAARGGISVSRWLIPLLALMAVALALYLFVFTRDSGEVVVPRFATSADPASSSAMVPGMGARPPAETPTERPTENSTSAITDFLKDAGKAFTEIKDEAGAKSAAETLQSLAGKVDTLGLDKLAGPAKLVVGPAIKKFLDDAKAWAEKAYAIPGVKEALEPAVNAIVDKLKGFAE